MSTFDRRAFLRTSTAAVVAASAVTTVAHAATGSAADEINPLLLQRAEIMQSMKEATREYDAAYDLLPWWAKSGPRYLHHDGSISDGNWGWPAIQGMTPPDHPLAMRLIRPSFATIRKNFEHHVTVWRPSPVQRAKCRAAYRKQVLELVDRLRARDAERAAVGLDDIEKRLDVLADQFGDVEDAIRDFPDNRGDPAVTAAKILLVMRWEAVGEDQCPADADCAGAALVGLLRTLRPALTGLLAEIVGDMLDNPERSFKESAFWPSG